VPTYEYACTACGHRLEAVQSFSDEPLTECPECGEALRKVYGAVGIVLKGSGFYKTDSRAAANGAKGNGKSADRKAGDTTSGDGAGTGSSSSEKSESGSGTSESKSEKGEKKDSAASKPAAAAAS
jgi:putative FmdB family regulatory protein